MDEGGGISTGGFGGGNHVGCCRKCSFFCERVAELSVVHASEVPHGNLLVIFTEFVNLEYAVYELARKPRKCQVCLICPGEVCVCV